MLLSDSVGPDRVDQLLAAIEIYKRAPDVFADRRSRPAPPLVLHRVREMYTSAAGKYRRIRAAWTAKLPRGNERREQARRATAKALRDQLQAAFPGMAEPQLNAIVNGTIVRGRESSKRPAPGSGDTRNVNDALRVYVARRCCLNLSPSRVRHAVTAASHLGPHGLDRESEQGLERFLRWIAEARPELRDDVAAWLDGILIARSGAAAPSEFFYSEYSPIVFEMARGFRRKPKTNPRQQLRVAAVEAFGGGDNKTAMELWDRQLIEHPARNAGQSQ